MKASDLKRALSLIEQKREIEALIKELNLINSPVDDPLHGSIPETVFRHVDSKLAAKGLLSLIIDRSLEVDKELASLGVDL